jgi:hypothetical protein
MSVFLQIINYEYSVASQCALDVNLNFSNGSF